MSDPGLLPDEKDALVRDLMRARADKGRAMVSGDDEAFIVAKRAIDEAKRALGERGPVWWDDGAPDLNRKMAKNTPYADWAAEQVEPN
ncbi:hypothetical protein [Sphingomicrobium sediminis]